MTSLPRYDSVRINEPVGGGADVCDSSRMRRPDSLKIPVVIFAEGLEDDGDDGHDGLDNAVLEGRLRRDHETE